MRPSRGFWTLLFGEVSGEEGEQWSYAEGGDGGAVASRPTGLGETEDE